MPRGGQVDVDGQPAELAAPRGDRARPSPRPGRARRPGRCPCPSATRRAARAPGRTSRRAAAVRRRARPGRRPRSSGGPRRRRDARAAIRIGVAGGVYLIAFSSDVGQRLVEEDRVDLDGRSVEVDVERAGRRAAAEPLEGPADEVVELEDVALGRSAPASIRLRSSRFVTSRLRYSTSRSIASALSRWSSALEPLPGPQRPGRRADRRERRAQVVRDRVEQRRLERVALARDLGGLRFGGQPVLARAPGRAGRPPRREAASRSDVGSPACRARAPPRSSRTTRRRPRSGPGRPRRPRSPRPAAGPAGGRGPISPASSPGIRWST